MKTLLSLVRKDTLVFAYILTPAGQVIIDWFFACNTDNEIIEHLKSEKVNCDIYYHK